MVIPVLFAFQDTALLIARLALAAVFLGRLERGNAKRIALFAVRGLVLVPVVVGIGVQAASLFIFVWSAVTLIIRIVRRGDGWQEALLLLALAGILMTSGGGRIALGEW